MLNLLSMVQISDNDFEELINRALDELPAKYIEGLKNVAITYEDEPTPIQREKLKLNCHETLFGLYEGIPLTKRGAGYNLVLPDKITIFKGPMTSLSPDASNLFARVKHTLWHEIAHYYGLDHDRIHSIERHWR
ncbi:MAG TPA: metallopeptidase family protein [Patescibacteria group bacterium]|nr:metallopeptidase family protein [Patescibacteria group bacterium]